MFNLFGKLVGAPATPVAPAAEAAPSRPDPLGRPTVHLLHIPKTAGTAIKAALEGVEGTERFALRLCPHGLRLSHVPAGDKVAFVLRDPVDRFVSGFFSRKRQGRPRYDSPWSEGERAAFARFETPEALARGLLSADRALRREAREAMRRINHVRTSYWDWFGDESALEARLGDVVFVARQERLGAEFPRFRATLGLPETLDLPRDEVRAHRNGYADDAKLSLESVEALRDWYARDYTFLRFCETRLGLEPWNGATDWQRRLAAAG